MDTNHTEHIIKGITEQLKKARQESGMSHETLARKIGVSRPAISHIESGKRKPSLLLAIKISHGLGMKLSSIIKLFEK